MELILRKTIEISNTILLPKELRDAIPWHSDRALVFDSITGSPTVHWLTNEPRAQAKLLVHETGQLNGKFDLTLNLDPETMRALGQFFIDLADQSDLSDAPKRNKGKG